MADFQNKDLRSILLEKNWRYNEDQHNPLAAPCKKTPHTGTTQIHVFHNAYIHFFQFSFRQETAKGHEGFDRRPASKGAETTKERIVSKSHMRLHGCMKMGRTVTRIQRLVITKVFCPLPRKQERDSRHFVSFLRAIFRHIGRTYRLLHIHIYTGPYIQCIAFRIIENVFLVLVN